MTTPPVTDDRRVYVGSGNGQDQDRNAREGFVAAFDGETGERLWRTTVTEARVRALAYADGTVIAGSSGYDPRRGGLTGLAARDGTEQWSVELPYVSPAGPVVVGDRVYASYPGGVTAVSLDGETQWRRELPREYEHISGGLCADGSSVYVGTDQGRLVALSTQDGHRQWERLLVTMGRTPRLQTIQTVVDGTLFVTATDSDIYAVDAATGETRWSVNLPEDRYGVARASLTVAGETVYANTAGGLVALSRADGAKQWDGGPCGLQPPVAAGDLVVTSTEDGTTRAYDSSGERRWTFEPPLFDAGRGANAMRPRAAVAHGQVYLALVDGRVFALASKQENSAGSGRVSSRREHRARPRRYSWPATGSGS